MSQRWQGKAIAKGKAKGKADFHSAEQVLLAVLLLSVALTFCFSDWLWRWDKLLYDLQLRFWNRPADSDIVIVAIDDVSLETLGHWPWPRNIHANLIDSLSAAGARRIGWHISFSSNDLNNPAADAALIEAVGNSKRVILPILLEQHNQTLREKPPFPQLVEAAAGLGHVDMELDPDGITRSVYLWAGLASPKWPTLALALISGAVISLPCPDRGVAKVSPKPAAVAPTMTYLSLNNPGAKLPRNTSTYDICKK